MRKTKRSSDNVNRPPTSVEAGDSVAKLTASWQRAHDARTKEIRAELTKQHPDSQATEVLLHSLVAHDIALTETLGRAENQLAQRLAVLPDRPAIALALARTLRQVVAAREGASRRVQALLETTGVLRGQRKLAEKPALRRVA